MADATFWVGQNGNIYYGSGAKGAPVQNLGSANGGQYEVRDDGLYDKFTDSGVPQLTLPGSRINDPSAPAAAPAGGGAGTAKTALNTQAIANTQGSIDQLGGILDRALAQNQGDFDVANRGFNDQEAGQRGTFDKGVTTNQQNYDSNLMASIGSGVRGLKGLMAILGGAGRGTAGDWARETVQGQTADDIRVGADTQKENQGALETTLNTNIDAINEKRRQNENTRLTNESSIRRDNATQAQSLYSDMAKLYSDGGDNARATEALTRAGGFTPQIAANSVAPRAAFDTTPAAVTAPSLTAFSGSSQPNVTATPNTNTPLGSGIFTISDARKRLAGAAA